MAMLIRWVETQPDISMPELAAKLEAADEDTRASRFVVARAARSGLPI